MKRFLAVVLLPGLAAGFHPTQAQSPDEATIFRAAGFSESQGVWTKCNDPAEVTPEHSAISERGDFNGDGRPDAIVTETGIYCFGMAGTGFTLVSQRADGTWAIIAEATGIPDFLDTRGADGWPDLQVGGPGFCFPVLRYNGEAYAFHRREYEGKPCQR